jgi:hypothetical protein
MKYTKPEVVLVANAIEAIQGSNTKSGPIAEGHKVTTPAYEADE